MSKRPRIWIQTEDGQVDTLAATCRRLDISYNKVHKAFMARGKLMNEATDAEISEVVGTPCERVEQPADWQLRMYGSSSGARRRPTVKHAEALMRRW